MTEFITWAEIEAEADDLGFRERLVALYRKHEGKATDEKDGQGRTVKVTQRSFAIHMGIGEDSFRRWVKQIQHGAGSAPDSTNQLLQRARYVAKRAPDQLVEAISELDPEAAADLIENALHATGHKYLAEELRDQEFNRKLPPLRDVNEADRKAIRAANREALEPLNNALESLKHVFLADQIDEITDEIRKGHFTEEERSAIQAATDRLVLALMEIHIRMEDRS